MADVPAKIRRSGTGRIVEVLVPESVAPGGPTIPADKTFYVSTAGVDTNDGSAAAPFKTLQRAFDALTDYGPILEGDWTISLAAGTYVGATLSSALRSTGVLTVKGPAAGHPNVPTVTITSGYNVSSYGIRAIETGLALTVQDVHFSGYNGSTSAAGIVVSKTPFELHTVNVHFTDCYWGISTTSAGYDVKGGIFTRCGFLGNTPNTTPRASRSGFGAGTRSLMLSRHSIGLQGAGNNTNGPYFYGCQNAVFAQEGSTGHCDWATIEDCGTGLYVGASSRVNLDGTSFKRNDRDIRVMLHSNVYVTSNVTFGTGADESGARVVASSGAQVIDDFRLFTDKYPIYGHSIRGLESQFPNTTVTATTNVTVYTATLAGGMWRDAPGAALTPRKRIRLSIVGELNGTLDNKRLIVRLGSAATSLLYSASETGVFVATADIYFSGKTEQQLILSAIRHLGTSARISRTVGSNDLTSDTALTVEALVDSTGDSVAIYSVDVSFG